MHPLNSYIRNIPYCYLWLYVVIILPPVFYYTHFHFLRNSYTFPFISSKKAAQLVSFLFTNFYVWREKEKKINTLSYKYKRERGYIYVHVVILSFPILPIGYVVHIPKHPVKQELGGNFFLSGSRLTATTFAFATTHE